MAKCKACKKAKALRLKELCGVCELVTDGGEPDGHRPSCWPMTSRFAGVCTDRELAKAREIDRKAGVLTEYGGKNGRDPIFRDRAHRKRYLKAHGLRDNDGGYGD